MRILCVAEKPSVAKSVTQILSGGQFTTRATGNNFTKNYDFNYPQMNAFFTMTSVAGHLFEHDFGPMFRKWSSCDPFQLFEAPVHRSTKKEFAAIAANLKTEARRSQMLMIWTDCDREGENIGKDIGEVCRCANHHITIKRARFSAIIPQQIHNAAQHPVDIDMAQANAVEVRRILDLRLGSAFTRLQTLNLQPRFQELEEMISYGPCQFPTLGFVVARYNQVRSFVPEPFWYIFLSLSRAPSSGGEMEETVFSWRRGHLFGFEEAVDIYERVLEDQLALVTKVTVKDTKKWKPLPLTTVDLQKAGSRLLRLSPKRVLDIAENLYQHGFLSYPRTETDQFDPQFDFMSLIEKQTVDPGWGAFATGLQNGGFGTPRRGKKNDKAHPPIHPTAHNAILQGDEKRVYEYITRRFLACCSKDALGWETTVNVRYGGEEFHATGLVVRERNYLNVFTYDKWSDKELPQFVEGETFVPSVCELREGTTSKPTLLTEADLVTIMDKNGIGTDATIAQHIQTIVDRNYVIERMHGATKYLVPSKLGIGLVEGYDAIGFEQSLSKPQLRRQTERRMVDICEGLRTMDDVLTESVEQYKEVFMRTKMGFNNIVTCVGNRLHGNVAADADILPDDDGNDGDGGGGGGGGGGRGGGGGGGRGGRGAGARGGARGGGVRPSNSRGGGGGRGGRGGGPAPAPRSRGPPPPPQPAPRPPPAPRNDRPDSDHYFSDDDPPPPRARAAPVQNAPASAPPRLQPAAEHPNCQCNVPAGERTTTRESVNKGRRFWTCGNERTCTFFAWMDESLNMGGAGPSRSAPPSKVVPTKRSFTNEKSGGPMPMCSCGKQATMRTTTKGLNEGRKYWTCPEPMDSKCGFFAWVEDGDGGGGGVGGPSRASGSQGGGKSDSCFQCGEEGHWASACPNQGSAAKRPKTFASGSGSSTAIICFKCNGEGHYSNSCPNGGGGGQKSYGANTGDDDHGGGGDGGQCFKCGEAGHFINACPNAEGTRKKTTKSTTSTRGTKRGRGTTRRTSSTRGGKKKASSSYIGAADDY